MSGSRERDLRFAQRERTLNDVRNVFTAFVAHFQTANFGVR